MKICIHISLNITIHPWKRAQQVPISNVVSPGELDMARTCASEFFWKSKCNLPELTVADRGTTAPLHEFPNIPAPFQSPHSLRKHCPGQLKAVVSSGSLQADLNFIFPSKHVKPYTDLQVCQLQCSQKSRCSDPVSWRSTRNLPVRTPQAFVPCKGLIQNHVRDGRKNYSIWLLWLFG